MATATRQQIHYVTIEAVEESFFPQQYRQRVLDSGDAKKIAQVLTKPADRAIKAQVRKALPHIGNLKHE